MNFQELIEALKCYYDNLYNEDVEGFEERDYTNGLQEFADNYHDTLPNGIGSYEQVYSSGHYNDNNWIGVMYFDDHDIYLQIETWYTSYGGLNFDNYGWNDIVQVYPYEKTITDYKTTKDEL